MHEHAYPNFNTGTKRLKQQKNIADIIQLQHSIECDITQLFNVSAVNRSNCVS